MRRAMGLLLLLVLLAAGAVAAHGNGEAPDPALTISWAAISGGGGGAAGGGYSLTVTAGQPVAGSLSGGGYTLSTGFWAVEVEPLRPVVYLPLMMSR